MKSWKIWTWKIWKLKEWNAEIVFSLISFAISIIALWFGVYTHYQLLPLQEASVVIPEDQIKFSAVPCKNSSPNILCKEEIDATLKNIGEAPAERVRIEIWGCFFDEDVTFGKSWPKFDNIRDGNCAKYFGADQTELVSTLSPHGTTGHVGIAFVPYHRQDNSFPVNFWYLNKSFVLFYLIKYQDFLTNEKTNQYFYRYPIGAGMSDDKNREGTVVSHLISSDYAQLYTRLLKEVDNIDSQSLLHDYLISHPVR